MYRHVQRCITPSQRHTRGYHTLYRIDIFCDIPRDPIIIFSNGWLNTSYMLVNLRSTACIVVESRGLSAQRFPTPDVARATPSYWFSSSSPQRYPRDMWPRGTRHRQYSIGTTRALLLDQTSNGYSILCKYTESVID